MYRNADFRTSLVSRRLLVLDGLGNVQDSLKKKQLGKSCVRSGRPRLCPNTAEPAVNLKNLCTSYLPKQYLKVSSKILEEPVKTLKGTFIHGSGNCN